jgi:4-hydroxybenzoate polyprenyltransferase
MSIKSALFYGFTIIVLLFILMLLIGHLWVFIILVIAAFISIAVSTINNDRKPSSDNKSSETSQ